MLDRYRDALRAPHVVRLLSTSLVARMPLGMSSLAILLLVTRHNGYARAGLVTGVYVAAAGVSNLLLARAADRWGPRRVLLPSAVGYAAGMAVLAAVPADAYLAELLVAAVTGLASPPVVSVVRGLWPRMLAPDIAQAVYGLEATAQELVFMTGPALVALIAGLTSAPVAVVATGAVALAGTLAFASTPVFTPPASTTSRKRQRLLSETRLPAYVGLGVAITGAFTMTELGVVAFVSGQHASAGSGVVLAVWSLGSLFGGLVYGAGRGRVDDLSVVRSVALMSATIASAAAAPGNVGLAVVMLVGGATIAPCLARLYSRVGSVAPEGASTEAFGWMAVGMLAGASLGAVVGGVTVEAVGARVDFLLAAALPASAAPLVLVWLTRTDRPGRVEHELAS